MKSSVKQNKNMAKRYTISAQARADIAAITRYISADNPAAARKMKAAMIQACELLVQHPHMGQERKDITSKPLRFWPVHSNYMIVYDPATNPVMIVRIYHSARFTAMLVPQ